jgi:hypothetical protein
MQTADGDEDRGVRGRQKSRQADPKRRMQEGRPRQLPQYFCVKLYKRLTSKNLQVSERVSFLKFTQGEVVVTIYDVDPTVIVQYKYKDIRDSWLLHSV